MKVFPLTTAERHGCNLVDEWFKNLRGILPPPRAAARGGVLLKKAIYARIAFFLTSNFF